MLKYGLKYGSVALVGVGAIGVAMDSYAKSLDPLGGKRFDSFVLQTTATASTAYSGLGQVQDTITGNVFYYVTPSLDGRPLVTDVTSGSNVLG